MRDVIVVGAGPSGSYASYALSSKGYDVLNLEEHMEIGKPVECTGLVSRRVTEMVRTGSVVNTVSGAHIFFPNGKSIHVHKKEKTMVLNRDSFDKDAAGQSIAAGTDLRIDARLRKASVSKDGVTVEYRERGNLKEERARIIIGADGMNSMVRKEVFGTRPYRVISAYQVDSAARLEDQDSVQVFVGSDVTRGFFGWATPSDNLTRIGVGTHGGASFRYFKSLNSRFGESKILGINGGGIPISYLRKTYSRRAMLVGDAAGIVKPLSGGGIYTGMVSGKHAAATAVDALEREDFSESAMSAYQRLWKKDLGNELWFDGMFQRLFSMISDRSFNRIYSILSSPEVIEKINERGDIDYPSRVVISLLARRPWLLRHIIQSKS